MTAAATLCECPYDPDAWDVLPRFWVPEEALRNPRNRNRDLYIQWKSQGWLETTPGNSTDYDFIEAAILQDAKDFSVKAVAIDRLFQGIQVSNHLIEEGLNVVAVGQGFLGQGPPMKEFERRWRACQVHHGDHPILNWMADNVEVKQDPAGNLKMVKPNHHNDPRKIDGMSALVNAMDCVAREVNEPVPQHQVMVFGGRRR
jgi:phage terminase large subunit-like protein